MSESIFAELRGPYHSPQSPKQWGHLKYELESPPLTSRAGNIRMGRLNRH